MASVIDPPLVVREWLTRWSKPDQACHKATEAIMIAVLEHRDADGRAMIHDKDFNDLAERAANAVKGIIAYAYDGR